MKENRRIKAMRWYLGLAQVSATLFEKRTTLIPELIKADFEGDGAVIEIIFFMPCPSDWNEESQGRLIEALVGLRSAEVTHLTVLAGNRDGLILWVPDSGRGNFENEISKLCREILGRFGMPLPIHAPFLGEVDQVQFLGAWYDQQEFDHKSLII